MRASVIIATYARPAALARAVGSLQLQTLRPNEVIVVAWDQDVETLRMLDDLLAHWRDGLRRILVRENTVRAKENAGIEAASGDIVCFMDDDAVARPEWLARIRGHYERPEVGAVGGRDVIWLDNRELAADVGQVGVVTRFGRLIGNHHQRVRGVRRVHFLKGCNMSFRRELLVPVDGCLAGPIPYGFEIDLGLEVRAAGRTLIYDPEILVDHYPTTNYSSEGAQLSWTVNHNQTYILLKRLVWPERIAFLLYTFLLGDRNTIGLARILPLMVLQRWPLRSVAAHFSGKIAGIRTYMRCQREGGQS